MKRFLIILGIFLTAGLAVNGLSARADEVELFNYANTNMKNFWEENGKYEQKVLDVGTKIINLNKIDKRIAVQANNDTKNINARTNLQNKTVSINYGILPYIDNDDELAFVIGHEMGHALDAYGGFLKWTDMALNSKEYEYKADLISIDLMAKAGYNPVAAICIANKWMPEDYWDFWIFTTHPKTSKRLMAMYKYIYRKYPSTLKTDMVHNVNYQNFTYSSQKEITEFLQDETKRAADQHRGDL